MRVDSRLWPVVWHGRGQAKSDRIDAQSQPSPTVQDSEPCSRVAHGIEEASSLIAPSLPEEYSPDYRSTHCTHCSALSWRRHANFSVFLDGADHNGSKPASLPTSFSATLHLANDEFACVPIVLHAEQTQIFSKVRITKKSLSVHGNSSSISQLLRVAANAF